MKIPNFNSLSDIPKKLRIDGRGLHGVLSQLLPPHDENAEAASMCLFKVGLDYLLLSFTATPALDYDAYQIANYYQIDPQLIVEKINIYIESNPQLATMLSSIVAEGNYHGCISLSYTVVDLSNILINVHVQEPSRDYMGILLREIEAAREAGEHVPYKYLELLNSSAQPTNLTDVWEHVGDEE